MEVIDISMQTGLKDAAVKVLLLLLLLFLYYYYYCYMLCPSSIQNFPCLEVLPKWGPLKTVNAKACVSGVMSNQLTTKRLTEVYFLPLEFRFRRVAPRWRHIMILFSESWKHRHNSSILTEAWARRPTPPGCADLKCGRENKLFPEE